MHYIGSSTENFHRFLDSVSVEGRAVVQGTYYGSVENGKQAAAALEFAAINIFRDTSNIEHIIVNDAGNSSELLAARLGTEVPIYVVTPSDGSQAYVLDSHKVVAHRFRKNARASELVNDVLRGVELYATKADKFRRHTDGAYMEKIGDEAWYNVPILAADGQGNVRLGVNPSEHGNLQVMGGLQVIYKSPRDAYFPIGVFHCQRDYRNHGKPYFSLRGDESASPAPLAAVSNPGFGSRRSRIELAVPHGNLMERLQERGIMPTEHGRMLLLPTNHSSN